MRFVARRYLLCGHLSVTRYNKYITDYLAGVLYLSGILQSVFFYFGLIMKPCLRGIEWQVNIRYF